jgi:hypothetical protein
MTGNQINASVNTLKAIKFGRVEDLDYKGGSNADRIYFNVTGQTSGESLILKNKIRKSIWLN